MAEAWKVYQHGAGPLADEPPEMGPGQPASAGSEAAHQADHDALHPAPRSAGTRIGSMRVFAGCRRTTAPSG
jgi:hypothetical protein